MKKVTEKDLSLDKQEVSNLTGGTGAGNETDNELICASKVCTDSQFEICCNDTDKVCPPVQTKQESCMCPVTNDSLCDACSDAETCTCPVTETRGCPVPETRFC